MSEVESEYQEMIQHHTHSTDSVVLSLCDYTGNVVKPWAQEGFECITVDVKHEGITVENVGAGRIWRVEADIRQYLPPRTKYRMVFSFPPCTNLAVSGARWFTDKGLEGLADGVELVERCRCVSEWSGAPWMLENPVSTLSTYWRSPDYTFHPYEYDERTDRDERYTKRTCLWTGNGFEMPAPSSNIDEDDVDNRIHTMPPGDDRSDIRSITPTGFSQAVFEANQ